MRKFESMQFLLLVKCKTFLVKISYICMSMKNHFQVKGLADNVVLIQRPKGTWKWPIKLNLAK